MANDNTTDAGASDVLRTDCLIIGAGLAGSTLGYLLKMAGRDVLLLEVCDAEKKDKLCAGAMSAETMDLLIQIFGPDTADALHPGNIRRVRNRIEGRETREEPKPGFFALPRKRLDDYVLGRCLEQKGQLLDRVSVRKIDIAAGSAECFDLRKKQLFTVQFETVIGADGATSATRRLITGKMPEVAPLLEAEVQKISNDMLMEFRFGRIGYSWYIPRDEGATVGAGFRGETTAFCRESLQLFLRGIGLDVDPQTIRGAFLPTGTDILLNAGKKAYFVGDAAGLIHPTLGAGIHYALISARCLARSLTQGDDYEDMMRPFTNTISHLAESAMKHQFRKNLSVYLKGTPAGELQG